MTQLAAACPTGPMPEGLFLAHGTNLDCSPGLAGFLAARDTTICWTTGDRVCTLGPRPDDRTTLVFRETSLDNVSGVAAIGNQTLYAMSSWQLNRYERATDPLGETIPHLVLQAAWSTGQVGGFDMRIGTGGVPLFTNSRCNGVSIPSDRSSFTMVWKAPWVSGLVSEDRCHVLGLELEDGELAWVTCAAQTDTERGWAEHRDSGGVLVDARSDEVVATGLSIPASPRLFGAHVLVANLGRGELVLVDPADGSTQVVALVPGYARGLAVLDAERVVLGVSRPRTTDIYHGAPIAARVASASARTGLVIINVNTGLVEHSVWTEGASGDVGSVTLLAGPNDAEMTSRAGGLTELISIG